MENADNQKIPFFQKELLSWYKTDGRDFYWRKHNLTNYQYIIAEILLQRTKAETVARFYSSFVLRFPNWSTIAIAPIEEISEFLKPVGLYRQRAKRLQLLAIEMVKRKGKLPKERGELESIPFMGQYIANAVELVIFHQPSPLMDVNMARVFERFFGKRKLADIRHDPYLQKLAYKVVNHKRAKFINWAILDFSALICKSRTPNCDICPVNTNCAYFLSKK